MQDELCGIILLITRGRKLGPAMPANLKRVCVNKVSVLFTHCASALNREPNVTVYVYIDPIHTH